MQITVKSVISLSIYCNICTVLDFYFKTNIDQRLYDGFDAVCLMTLEIFFSILCWLSMGRCYLLLSCSRRGFIVFSCGLKAVSETFLFLPRIETNWQENAEIKMLYKICMASIQHLLSVLKNPCQSKLYCRYPKLGMLVNHVMSLSFEIQYTSCPQPIIAQRVPDILY